MGSGVQDNWIEDGDGRDMAGDVIWIADSLPQCHEHFATDAGEDVGV